MERLHDSPAHLHPYRGFVGVSPSERARDLRLFGKPLYWTRGWKLVLVVLAAAGALLLCTRLGMGSLPVWSPREARAIRLVLDYRPVGRHSVRQIIAENFGPNAGEWYAVDRRWEDRVYVIWEWRGHGLVFAVEGREVIPDEGTRRGLERVESRPSATGGAASSAAQP